MHLNFNIHPEHVNCVKMNPNNIKKEKMEEHEKMAWMLRSFIV
jgi:hypothetical protein